MKNKLKILFVGASGYGNLGDDCYKTNFTKLLSNDFELFFDAPYPDESILELGFSALVVGGGGLIYQNNTLHLDYMSRYLDKAIALKIPIYFLSVGLQYYPQFMKTDDLMVENIRQWEKYLLEARIVFLRSRKGVDIVRQLNTKIRADYSPDLGYLTKPCGYHLIRRNSSVFIVTPSRFHCESHRKVLEEAIKREQKEGNDFYFIAMSRDDYEITKELGRKYSGSENLRAFTHLSPEEARQIIEDASRVYTGRYHGLLFAQACGKEVFKLSDSFKMRYEENTIDFELIDKMIYRFKKDLTNYYGEKK